MAVSKIVTNSYEPLGKPGTRGDNEMTPEIAVWLATPDFNPTPAQLANEIFIDAAIKAEQLFPLPGLDNYESRDKEDTIYEAPSGNQKLTKRGIRRKTYHLDIPTAVSRALQASFNNADLRQYRIHDNGSISFFHNGLIAQGFSTSMINIGMMKDVPADGSTPSFTPVMINMANWREWDQFGDSLIPSWEPASKEGLIPVTLELVGTATASEITIKVYSADGFNSAGLVNEVLIKGIVEADWVSTGGAWTATTGYTDNADGTYTFTSAAAFTTGGMNLKTPVNMVSEGLLIKSNGAAPNGLV